MTRSLAIVAALVFVVPALGAAQHAGYGTSDMVHVRHVIVPTVTVGRWMRVTGPLDRAIARRVLFRHFAEVRYCYEQRLMTTPHVAGSVVVRFTVGRTGAVTSSELVSSTITFEDVPACIVRATRRWTFPAVAADVVVLAPYVLAERRQ